MADYGQPLEFGFFLDPAVGDPKRSLEIAQVLDESGFDLIGIQDHPYQAQHFDAFALAGVILGKTSRIRVFHDVANLPLRPPLMLAKQAATLDQLSGGRFELGLGAGAYWDPIRAMGGPVRTTGEARRALAEAISLIRSFWTERSLRHDGEFYQAIGTRPGPIPWHDIQIWLGVFGPRALKLTGEVADGWIPSMPYVTPGQADKSNAIIDAAAIAAGREPSAIRRIYNVPGDFSPIDEAGSSDEDTQIVGPVKHWIDVLSHLAVVHGFSTFVLWMAPTGAKLRMFMEEIAPAVRDRVAEIRASRGVG